MKLQRKPFILALLMVFVCAVSMAFAAKLTIVAPASTAVGQQAAIEVQLDELTATQIEQLKASGAAFTMEYDPGLVIVNGSLESPFFDTFTAQFNAAQAQGANPQPYTVPVTVDGESYDRPLVQNNSDSSKTILAAARCMPTNATAASNNVLFRFKAVLESGKTAGSYNINLKPTVLNNTQAGYAAEGEPIDILVGSDPTKKYTETGAFPVILAKTMTPVVRAVVFGGIDTDGDGIDDTWEMTHFGNLTTANGTSDKDGDGISDKNEYLGGSDPNDENDPNIQPTLKLDIDGNGAADALTDGVMVVRYLFGFTGSTLINGAVGNGATRTTADAIKAYLDQLKNAGKLDVDANNAPDALTDGVLVVRYFFGFTGSTLINSAIGNGATRTTADQVSSFLQTLKP
jgi:hypothetical protein